MDQRQADRNRHARQKADPGVSGHVGDRTRPKGSAEHLPFQADIDHAGAFRVKPRQTGQQKRCRQADCGIKCQDHDLEHDHASFSARAREGVNSLMMVGRNMCSSAPANRITRPWMTMIMSRVMLGISNESSAPP